MALKANWRHKVRIVKTEKKEPEPIRSKIIRQNGKGIKVTINSRDTFNTVVDTKPPVLATDTTTSNQPHGTMVAQATPATPVVSPPTSTSTTTTQPVRFVDYGKNQQSTDPYAGGSSTSKITSPSYERAAEAVYDRYKNPSRSERLINFLGETSTSNAFITPSLAVTGPLSLGVSIGKGVDKAFLFGRSLTFKNLGEERQSTLISAIKPASKVYENPYTYVYAGLGAATVGASSSAARAANTESVFMGRTSSVVTPETGGLSVQGTVSGNIVQANRLTPIARTYNIFESGTTGKIKGTLATTFEGKSFNQKISGFSQEGRATYTIKGGGLPKTTDTVFMSDQGGFAGVVEQPVFNARLQGLNFKGVARSQSYSGVEKGGEVAIAINKAKTGFVDVSGEFKPLSVGKRGSASFSMNRGSIFDEGTGGSGALVSEMEVFNVKPMTTQFTGYSNLGKTSSGFANTRALSFAGTGRNVVLSGGELQYKSITGNWADVKPLEVAKLKPQDIFKTKIISEGSSKVVVGGDGRSSSRSIPVSDVVPVVDTGSVVTPDVIVDTAPISDGSTRTRSMVSVMPAVGTVGYARFRPAMFGDITMPVGGFGSSKGFEAGIFGGRKKKYTPSLYAVVGDIEGDVDFNAQFTGFEVRPLGRRKHRKAKK